MPDHQRPLRIAAIVCAAGSGTRFGTTKGGKLDADLHGKPVLIRSVEAIARQPEVEQVIVAGPADPSALKDFRDRHGPALAKLGATICPGGVAERFETVKAALDHLLQTTPEDHLPDAVLVHDAARPCTPEHVLRAVIDGLASHPAVIPAVPLADTIKRASPATPDTKAPPVGPRNVPASGAGCIGTVDHTVDRAGLYACQTPQGFHLSLLREAYAQADLSSTDDAQLVERLGEPVTLVAGDPRNIKITRPADLDLARAIWPTLSE
ncbi:MAG: 2-C-methyl-D-erythritol 4-phosphate cytidylyltransferase [Phycisphaerales bacterium JB064]